MIQTREIPVTVSVSEHAEITGQGLKLPVGLSFDDWLLIGRKLMLADKAVQWALGDWWSAGEHAYGERAAAAIDPVSGQNRLQRYANYAWVARSIETSRRREVLSWSVHEAVAALDPEIQDGILNRAVENGWGSREVRAAVREYKTRMECGNKPRLSAQTPDVEDAEIVEDSDKSVFDSTAAGQAMQAESRKEVLQAYSEQSLSSANQRLLGAIFALKTMRLDADFMAGLDPAGLSAQSIHNEADWLLKVAREIRHRQNTEFDSAPAGVVRGANGGEGAAHEPSSPVTTSDRGSFHGDGGRRTEDQASGESGAVTGRESAVIHAGNSLQPADPIQAGESSSRTSAPLTAPSADEPEIPADLDRRQTHG